MQCRQKQRSRPGEEKKRIPMETNPTRARIKGGTHRPDRLEYEYAQSTRHQNHLPAASVNHVPDSNRARHRQVWHRHAVVFAHLRGQSKKRKKHEEPGGCAPTRRWPTHPDIGRPPFLSLNADLGTSSRLPPTKTVRDETGWLACPRRKFSAPLPPDAVSTPPPGRELERHTLC